LVRGRFGERLVVFLLFILQDYHAGRICSYLCNNAITAAQQGAAPDLLQLRSSFLLAALPAAGELSR